MTMMMIVTLSVEVMYLDSLSDRDRHESITPFHRQRVYLPIKFTHCYWLGVEYVTRDRLEERIFVVLIVQVLNGVGEDLMNVHPVITTEYRVMQHNNKVYWFWQQKS